MSSGVDQRVPPATAGGAVDPASTGAPVPPASRMSRRRLLALLGTGAVATPLVAISACAESERSRVSATAATPTASPSPTTTRVAALDPQDCILRQEFDGTAGGGVDTSVWTVQTGAGGWGNGEQENYTSSADNLSLDGAGNLRITMRDEATTDAYGNTARFTSARIISAHAYQATRIEARISCPSGEGVWPAFWTLGADWQTAGWPKCGELDIAEMLNDARHVNAVVHAATIGTDGAVAGNWKDTVETVAPTTKAADAFRIFAVDITSEALTFSIDRVVRLVTLRADRLSGQDWPFEQAQHVLLNLAMSRALPANQKPALPVDMLVDYVRVWGTAS